jgi:dihydrodipicolinate synthase (EC 4.2.1.52)
MKKRSISGSAVALVTPFKRDESIDETALRRLVQFHIEGGTDIIIPCGTTGESPVLSADEQRRIIEIVKEEANGKIRVMGGAGSNSTHHAVELAKAAEKAGAEAILPSRLTTTSPRRKAITVISERLPKPSPCL